MGIPRPSLCQCGTTVGHSIAVMARILPTLVLLAVFIAAHEAYARSLNLKGANIRKFLAAMKRMNSVPLSKSEVDHCPDGGQTLSATGDVQTFHVTEYSNNMDCTWEITADAGMAVYIEIPDYAIENAYMCGYDYLAVDEGTGTPVHLCGQGSYSGYSVDTVMHLHFHTDYSVTHNGFTVHYKQVPAAAVPRHVTMQDAAASGLTLTADADTQILTSHSGAEYSNDMDVTTTVTAPAGMMVRLAVQAFDVEYACTCGYDFVEIYNKVGDLMHTWCGGEANGQENVSMESMSIRFKTDGSVTATGFIFHLTIVDPSTLETYQLPNYEATSCPGPLEINNVTDAITIASPNYGIAQYSNHMECSWSLTTAPGKYLSVRFVSLDIEHHAACQWDGLYFFDASSIASGHAFATICGHNTPDTFTSSSSELFIEFSTDYSVTDGGFLLEISAVDEPISLPEDPCNVANGPMHIAESGAELASPALPTYPAGSGQEYLPNSECSWIAHAPNATQTVTFTFTSFHLEEASGWSGDCWYDYLSFYNGAAPDEDKLIGKYGGDTSPERITSTGSVMLIKFVSDYCIQHAGFHGMVTFGNDDPTPPEVYESYYSPGSDYGSDSAWMSGMGSGSDSDSAWMSGMGSGPDSDSAWMSGMGSDSDFSSSPDMGSDSDSSNGHPNVLPVKIVKWATDDKSLKAKEDKSEAAFKRKMAEITRKGAAESKKLVEFFRAVHQQRPLFTTIAVGAATLAGGTAANALWSWLG